MTAQQRHQQKLLEQQENKKHLFKALYIIYRYLTFQNGKPMQTPREEIRYVLFKIRTLETPTETAMEHFEWLARATEATTPHLRLQKPQLEQTRTFIEACLWISEYLAENGSGIHVNRASKTDKPVDFSTLPGFDWQNWGLTCT